MVGRMRMRRTSVGMLTNGMRTHRSNTSVKREAADCPTRRKTCNSRHPVPAGRSPAAAPSGPLALPASQLRQHLPSPMQPPDEGSKQECVLCPECVETRQCALLPEQHQFGRLGEQSSFTAIVKPQKILDWKTSQDHCCHEHHVVALQLSILTCYMINAALHLHHMCRIQTGDS